MITGGAVKLTAFMRDRIQTQHEKNKLDAVVELLGQNDIEGKMIYLEICNYNNPEKINQTN